MKIRKIMLSIPTHKYTLSGRGKYKNSKWRPKWIVTEEWQVLERLGESMRATDKYITEFMLNKMEKDKDE